MYAGYVIFTTGSPTHPQHVCFVSVNIVVHSLSVNFALLNINNGK